MCFAPPRSKIIDQCSRNSCPMWVPIANVSLNVVYVLGGTTTRCSCVLCCPNRDEVSNGQGGGDRHLSADVCVALVCCALHIFFSNSANEFPFDPRPSRSKTPRSKRSKRWRQDRTGRVCIMIRCVPARPHPMRTLGVAAHDV